MYEILLVIHTILVLFLIGMVLIQRTDSDGLGGLGGGGGNQFLTGRSAANLLTRTTAILAGLFMITSLVLAVMASRANDHSIIDSVKMEDTEKDEGGNKHEDTKPAAISKDVPKPAGLAVPKPE